MDPATLAATAITTALPYLAGLAKAGAKSAAQEAGKSVWQWVKGKLTSEAGKEAIKDVENSPDDATNRTALEAALTKHLRSDVGAFSDLLHVLAKAGVSADVKGNHNAVGQVAGSGNVTINQGRTS